MGITINQQMLDVICFLHIVQSLYYSVNDIYYWELWWNSTREIFSNRFQKYRLANFSIHFVFSCHFGKAAGNILYFLLSSVYLFVCTFSLTRIYSHKSHTHTNSHAYYETDTLLSLMLIEKPFNRILWIVIVWHNVVNNREITIYSVCF